MERGEGALAGKEAPTVGVHVTGLLGNTVRALACKHVQSCYKTVLLNATANEAQSARSYP